MFLKKLEIYGFKSFANRIEMQFDKGITAIVGPNGSGKSNVGDAVRWVLGEQSAKSLRGSKMEDIIFNGTEKRKALGFAEVSLTLDNTDGALPIAYSEVTITRRIFRSGESEYYINRTGCRLKDITELFMDTGVGKEGYSIIGQGRIDDILSTKSEDRRTVFEEAAGIVKYKSRKETAEKKLDQTNQNLLRLEDIIEELSSQLEPLREQSDTAKTYLSLKEELKELEINIFIHQYEKIKQELNKLSLLLAGVEDENNFNSQRLEAIDKILEEEDKKIELINKEIGQLQEKTLELTSSIEKSDGDNKVLQERIQNIFKDNERMSEQIEKWASENNEIQSALAAAQTQADNKKQDRKMVQHVLSNLEIQVRDLSGKIHTQEKEMEISKGNIIEYLNRLSDVKSKITRFHTIQSSIDKRLMEINKIQDSTDKEHNRLEMEVQEVTKLISEAGSEKDKYTARKKQLENQSKEKQNEIRKIEEQMQNDRGDIHSLTSKLHVLTEMKKDFEGFQSSIKRLLKDCEYKVDLKNRVCGVVAQLVTVPKYLERPIEMALGGSLQNIVTETEYEAKVLIEYLRKNHYGRATFLPVSAVRGRYLNEHEKAALNTEGCIGVAADLIKYNNRYEGIFQNLLGRTVIVKNMDVGISISKVSRQSFRIVTLDGDILNSGGSMTGGSIQSQYSSLLGREREIGDIQKKLDKLNKEYKSHGLYLAEMKKEKDNIDVDLKALEKQMHELEIDLTKARERLGNIRRDIQNISEQKGKMETEHRQLMRDSEEITLQMNELQRAQDDLEKNNLEIQQNLSQSQDEFKIWQEEKETLSEEITKQRIQLASQEKEYNNYLDEMARLNKEHEKNSDNMEREKKNIEENCKLIIELQDLCAKKSKDMEAKKEQLKSNQSFISEKEKEKEKIQNELKGKEREKRDLLKDQNQILEKKHRIEIQYSKMESELENIQTRIWEDYELSYLNALEYRNGNLNITQAPKRIETLKLDIRNLGTVNVNAIDDYKKVHERYEFLNIQRADLLQAGEHLEDVIQELLSTMENQFRDQFAMINKNFNDVFQKLFGGGKAELNLQDENDVLNCGIDIIAQPPGKKLQSLSLLSGGERALTAIAILFAILKLKPTPFCILDEIEAALDEANVYNFAKYLGEYSAKTQFVVITHRKGTMEVGDTLYGVSMEEKGVSNLVSVRLSEKVS